MRTTKENTLQSTLLSLVLIAAFAVGLVPTLCGQTRPELAVIAANIPTDSQVVLHHPFSATKYLRHLAAAPNGELSAVAIRQNIQLSRDNAGRIKFVVGTNPRTKCKPVSASCPLINNFIFDPNNRTMTHWLEGKQAYPGVVIVKLTGQQVDQVEELTSAMRLHLPLEDDETSIKSLGAANIKGVDVMGLQVTTIKKTTSSQDRQSVTTREIWWSAQMRLIVKVTEVDSSGQGTSAGLEHISLGSNSMELRPPEGWPTYRRDDSNLAEGDIKDLAEWFVE